MHTSEAEHESHFIKVFAGVLIALILFTLFCVVMARAIAPPEVSDGDSILRASLMERIEPVARVNTSAEQIDSAAPAVADTGAAGPETPQQLVDRACAACHLAGVAGAPKLDDADDWARRREAGLDALLASVINGKGAMPARAGTDLSDEQLKQAVQQIAGFAAAGDADSGAATASETTTAAADSTAEDSAAASTAVAAVASESAAAPSERVKTVTDTLCLGCHLAGVAGAPKIGDQAAWAERAVKGMDEMVSIVAAGQGAMPPRGGSDLNDDEIAAAIQYLMDKEN